MHSKLLCFQYHFFWGERYLLALYMSIANIDWWLQCFVFQFPACSMRYNVFQSAYQYFPWHVLEGLSIQSLFQCLCEQWIIFTLMPRHLFICTKSLTILGTLLKCFGLSCMGHKCLRFELFKIDENFAFCDIQAEKLTLGWDLDVQSKILICLIQSFQLLNGQFWSPWFDDSDDFQQFNIQFQPASSNHSEYAIFNSDPPNPIIPIIEYSIPIHLIWSFWLLNIQFQST